MQHSGLDRRHAFKCALIDFQLQQVRLASFNLVLSVALGENKKDIAARLSALRILQKELTCIGTYALEIWQEMRGRSIRRGSDT